MPKVLLQKTVCLKNASNLTYPHQKYKSVNEEVK